MSTLLLLAALTQPMPETDVSLADLARFPPYEVCKAHADLGLANYQHWQRLLAGALPREVDYLQAGKREAWDCWWLWDNLRIASDPSHSEEVRLHWLRDTRSRLGLRAYLGGAMPPPVPVWRFQERRE